VQFICNITVSPSALHHAVVSLKRNNEDTSNNFMKLHQHFRRHPIYNYTVCLEQPLYGETSPLWFIQWVEANVIFGAEKFLVHSYNITSSFAQYLEYYVSIGLIESLPWAFPPGLEGETHCYLQQTMISDCQYRLQGFTRQVKYNTQALWHITKFILKSYSLW